VQGSNAEPGIAERSISPERESARRKLQDTGRFFLIGADEEQPPLVAFQLTDNSDFNEFDVAWQLSAERGWIVPAYTLPPNAQEVTIMRALVKETLSREHVDTLGRDIEEACATLEEKGGAHESERRKMVTGSGH
jgi:glutamate decarboxylase